MHAKTSSFLCRLIALTGARHVNTVRLSRFILSTYSMHLQRHGVDLFCKTSEIEAQDHASDH